MFDGVNEVICMSNVKLQLTMVAWPLWILIDKVGCDGLESNWQPSQGILCKGLVPWSCTWDFTKISDSVAVGAQHEKW